MNQKKNTLRRKKNKNRTYVGGGVDEDIPRVDPAVGELGVFVIISAGAAVRECHVPGLVRGAGGHDAELSCAVLDVLHAKRVSRQQKAAARQKHTRGTNEVELFRAVASLTSAVCPAKRCLTV